MKRTKNMLPSNSRNISTQTENFDSLIEIAKLEEQVRVMQLEINILRKHVETSKKPDNVVYQKATPLVSQETVQINNEKSSCGCKRNCSSRICSCVKKNNKCNPSCKCDDKLCQNQKLEHNEEDKENINKINMTPRIQKMKKNKATEKNNGGLFSPDVTYLHNANNVELKEKGKKKEENKKQQELVEKVIFDPMKPRHQLSRTPPKKMEKCESLEMESLEIEDIIQFQPYSKLTQEIVTSSHKNQDITEERVDWEKHTAQLIPCKKCKRTFMPDRIKKHETCCKKI